jgi:hypothetical protein
MSAPGCLVVMRLADMHKMHPDQDSSRVCSGCGAPVGIYPSGQAMLKSHPGLAIVCKVCIAATHDPADISMLAAPLEQIREEARQSVPVKKQ